MIGVFDSGVGGLSVFQELVRQWPQYDYVYLGDSARAPYGNKSAEVIYEYTRQALTFLFSLGCQIVVLACNTASARAEPILSRQEQFKNRLLGVVQPTARAAVQASQRGRLGVIGTAATIKAQIFAQVIKSENPAAQVFSRPAPLLVPLVEAGWIKRPVTRKIVKHYLRPLKQQKIDTLILGCTHYPFLLPIIKPIIGRSVKIISAPAVMPAEIGRYLEKNPARKKSLSQKRKRQFYTTDDPQYFLGLANRLVGQKIIGKAEKAKLKI